VSRRSPHPGARAGGFILLVVLAWLALLASLALGVSLVTMYEPTSAAAAHDRVRLRRAAESAVTLALTDLATRADWSTLPAGGAPSPFTDGGPGVRIVDTFTVDLVAETALRICGRVTACDDTATTATSDGRPWGARNPRWRLFVHLPLATLDPAAAAGCACYLVAWVADDPGDDDGDPLVDAPGGTPGHGTVLVRGAAFAAGGAVAEVEALVAQPCRLSGAVCPGIRVQSWGTVGEGVP
jgi:hypothetical protein